MVDNVGGDPWREKRRKKERKDGKTQIKRAEQKSGIGRRKGKGRRIFRLVMQLL